MRKPVMLQTSCDPPPQTLEQFSSTLCAVFALDLCTPGLLAYRPKNIILIISAPPYLSLLLSLVASSICLAYQWSPQVSSVHSPVGRSQVSIQEDAAEGVQPTVSTNRSGAGYTLSLVFAPTCTVVIAIYQLMVSGRAGVMQTVCITSVMPCPCTSVHVLNVCQPQFTSSPARLWMGLGGGTCALSYHL